MCVRFGRKDEFGANTGVRSYPYGGRRWSTTSRSELKQDVFVEVIDMVLTRPTLEISFKLSDGCTQDSRGVSKTLGILNSRANFHPPRPAQLLQHPG